MRLIRILRQRARSLLRGARADAELARELAFHLEQLTRENIAAGMEPAAARLAARRALGGVAQIEEQCRDHRRVGWLTDLYKDFAYAARTLGKSPGFTALAAVTLAFGVGASIAVYTLSEALLLRSLPFPEPQRLVSLHDLHVRRGASGVGQDNFRDWQASNTVFERMAYSEFSQVTLTGHGDAERITGSAVSEGFFEMMGAQPQLGRWFTPEEQKPGAPCACMVSHGFWTRKLGARPDVVGGTLAVDDRPCRIAGVMPESFRIRGYVAEYWTPVSYVAHGRMQHQYDAYARLRPGVAVEAAQAQMSEIARRLAQTYPEDHGWGVQVQTLRGELLRPFRDALAIVAAAAMIVLLMACGNVASLLLARGIGRSKEIAVRVALGAGRGRVVRLLVTEGLLLSAISAGLGSLVAVWLIRLAIAAAPPWLGLGAGVSVSVTVVVFAIGLTLATGLLTSLWPALRGSRADLLSGLKESGAGLVAGRRQVRSLNGLVVMEVALAVVLLTFAGLLMKSLAHLSHTGLGYRTDRVLTFRMPLPSSRYATDAARLRFWDTLLAELTAVPGVLSAAASDSIPMGGTFNGAPVEIEGETNRRDWADVMTRDAVITPDYFRTMGIGLRAGRTFTADDTARAGTVIIVNEAFVRKLLHGRAPIGTRVRFGPQWLRVVGVIGDERYFGPAREPEAEAYVPYTLFPYLQFVSIHTAVPEETVLAAVRRVIRRLDPQLPMTQVRTLRESVDLSMDFERQMMALVGGFAAVALVMATMGLGGVMIYLVSRKRREIGLRMALGASRADVARGVMGGALRLVLVGGTIGAATAFASARALGSLLYGVHSSDPAVLMLAPAALGAVALLACVLPARQAASVDPVKALRQE
jgi:putative ABC transport system permease protein